MFRILLATCLLLTANAQMTNVDYSSNLQKSFSILLKTAGDIQDETNLYFTRIGNPSEYHESNYDKLQQNIRLLEVLKENITSTMTIANYTLAFQASEVELSLQREKTRAESVEAALAGQTRRGDGVGGELGGAGGRLAEARAQQGRADETMNEVQVRLLGLRRSLDALIKREGELEFRLQELLLSRQKHKARANAVFEGEREAKENVEKVKRKTKEIVNAINQARSELQALKAKGRDAPTSLSSSPTTTTTISGVNYIKSVKTASGKGKRIRLVLLSD